MFALYFRQLFKNLLYSPVSGICKLTLTNRARLSFSFERFSATVAELMSIGAEEHRRVLDGLKAHRAL